MSRRSAGAAVAHTTAACLATLVLAGCAAEPAVSPLPTEAVTPSPAAGTGPAGASPASAGPAGTGPTGATSARAAPSASPTARTRPAPPPPTRRTPRPTTKPPSPACQGAVVHTIDLTTDELALAPALCFGTGAVLRVENIGPGEVTTDAPQLVDQNYEAGIVEIRFLRAGTVVVTIPQGGTAHDLTVVVR